jgi:hypothetical protein
MTSDDIESVVGFLIDDAALDSAPPFVVDRLPGIKPRKSGDIKVGTGTVSLAGAERPRRRGEKWCLSPFFHLEIESRD